VFPEGMTKIDDCCFLKAKREIKQTIKDKTPILKYVLFLTIILKI